jgi:hypothetical protein
VSLGQVRDAGYSVRNGTFRGQTAEISTLAFSMIAELPARIMLASPTAYPAAQTS